MDLKALLKDKSESFFPVLLSETAEATSFEQVLKLNTLRRRAASVGLGYSRARTLKLAIVGAGSLRPTADLVEHFTTVLSDFDVQLWVGDYDNYIFEITDEDSDLYSFGPEVIMVLPSEKRCRPTCTELDPIERQMADASHQVDELIELCRVAHDRSGAEIVLGNFRLPPGFDPGPARSSSLASDYNFRKYVNIQLGLKAPAYVHLLDIEFLSNRIGTEKSFDDRTWFESKQPFSMDLAVSVSREFSKVVSSLRKPPKKVIVLDLDNTLWGGVIGDDGLEGIEIGTTSPRGEAFRAFQEYLLSMTKRGVLLAVCSKNDMERAVEPFVSHPEMVLRLANIVNFKANWEPKSENIRQIATELSLGLDSFVFVDDNPAEIEIVRQFLPEVTCIWIGDDPSRFTRMLQDSRLFEYRSLTAEDLKRVDQYKQEAKRQELASTATDMDSYLTSLCMVADIKDFDSIDTPRISQLINKSNQFNLTTIRRTEAEVREILTDPMMSAFTIRLSDRFGDHGLIAVVIGRAEGKSFLVDTWLMSCRVLKRQVEEITINEIVRRARLLNCNEIIGQYRPTAKNKMVSDLYPRLGFTNVETTEVQSTFKLEVEGYIDIVTKIQINEVI